MARKRVSRVDYSLPQEQVTIQVVQRLRECTSITAKGCWQWDGWLNSSGYGETSYRGNIVRVHRLAYMLLVGPIPDGMDICHKCDHSSCWNPAHLESGSQKKNSQEIVERGRNRNEQKTHCPRGHEYAVHGARYGKTQYRSCRVCDRATQRIRMGWPIELAYSLDIVPPGFIVVGAGTGRRKNTGKRPYKTHCSQGHEKSGDNLYITPEGRRHCKLCRLANVIKSGLKAKAARLSVNGTAP